ncbi:MAG: hypothetical protein QXQ70_03185 [Candidatus Caldarchaeum sp.]
MSWRKLLGRLRNTASTPELADMQRLGIVVTTNDLMLARLDSINSYIKDLIEKLNADDGIGAIEVMNNMLQNVAVPWLKSRDFPALAVVMNLWAELIAIAKNGWHALTHGEPESNIPAIKATFRRFVERNILPAGYTILSYAWSTEDVTPSYVNVIRGAQQGSGGIVTPRSSLPEEAE